MLPVPSGTVKVSVSADSSHQKVKVTLIGYKDQVEAAPNLFKNGATRFVEHIFPNLDASAKKKKPKWKFPYFWETAWRLALVIHTAPLTDASIFFLVPL